VRFTDMCSARGLPFARIGVVDRTDARLEVQGQFSVPLAELRRAWASTLPRALD
jgi:phosphoribosylformylglycinamidine synthase